MAQRRPGAGLAMRSECRELAMTGDDRCAAENEGGRCVKKAGHSGRHLGQELETFAELFGRLGGLATAAKLTPAERSAKARKAAAARWNRRDGQ